MRFLRLQTLLDAGRVGCFLAATICFSNPLGAQTTSADPIRGYQLAQRLCVACHAIESRETATVNPDVPSFSAIARQPNASAERLAGRIIVPHPAMPNTQLTTSEIRDVIAYILSLKPTR